MRGARRHLALVALLALAVTARAQDTAVQAEVDARKLGVDDQVQLTLTVSGPSTELAEEPVLPQLTNLRAVAGPFVSTQFSWVNGRASQSRSYTWTLQPVAPGAAQVGALRVKLAAGEKSTATIALEVLPGSIRPQRRARAADPFDPFGSDPFDDVFGRRRGGGARQEPKLRVSAVASRTRLHVGEPLVITYYVDTTVSLTDAQFKEPPQYAGFWAEELERQDGPPGGQPVTIDGQEYRRFPLLRRLLFPTKAGSLTVPATTLRLGIARQSFFDAGGVVERATQPLTITAEAIPSASGFSGAVGRFRVSANLDKETLAFGEAATLRFQVEGSGNLKWVEHGPELALPGVKVYPPQVKSALQAGPDGLAGTKTWEYVLVPETSGTLEVPALVFEFFDPRAGQLQTARTVPLTLRVGVASAGAVAPAAAPAAVAAPGTTRGLSLRSALDPARHLMAPVSPSLLAWLVGLALAGHAALFAGARLVDRGRLAAGRPASSRGLRHALHDLRRAGRGDMSKEAAAALIEKALHETFGTIEDGAPAGEGERAARAVLQDVQFLRYAPQLGDYSEKIREVAARAEEVVRRWA